MTLRTAWDDVTSASRARASSGMCRLIQSASRVAWAVPVTMKYASAARRVTVRSDSYPPRSLSIAV